MLWKIATKLAQSFLARETAVVQAGLKGCGGGAIAAFNFGTSCPSTLALESDLIVVNYLRTKAVTSYLINFKWVVCSYVCKAKWQSTSRIFSTKFCVQIY